MDDRGRLAQSLKRPHVFARLGRAIHRLASTLENRIPRGAGHVAAFTLIAASVAYGSVRGGHVDTIVVQFKDARDALANAAGFYISSIALVGQAQLTREQILATAGVTGRTSLLFLNADDARLRLKANPWIADATVLKLYPDRLHISVTERRPYALWQKDGRVSVIAGDGTVLETYVDPQFAKLPLVVGQGAAQRAADFLALMDRYPAIRDQARAYVLVAERRWNIKLKNGLDVRLPEAQPERAIETLIALDRDKKLLTRDITAIDLRLADRVTVRLSDAAAQERNRARDEALKDKKTRRKAGDA
ncbi:MAG: FtsQ-type POTRA domain-containing protein [Pseudorhodoplanes sp.]|nr:FtsQ-type POTRA domain-containing protein [Pseudorhodoplanes sp.]